MQNQKKLIFRTQEKDQEEKLKQKAKKGKFHFSVLTGYSFFNPHHLVRHIRDGKIKNEI